MPVSACGPVGPQGETGPAGPQGATGPTGPQGVVNFLASSASGTNPSQLAPNTWGFVGPVAQLAVAEGQKVHLTANKAMGSTAAGGASGLGIAPCYQSTAGGAPVVPQGGAILGLQVAQNTRAVFGVSWVFSGLAAGEYKFGMCANVAMPVNWNSNEYGYSSALVFN